MKRLYFKPNTDVIKEGDLGDCAYIVEAGSLEVSKINDQNNKQILGRLKEHDIFGEFHQFMSFFRCKSTSKIIVKRDVWQKMHRESCSEMPKRINNMS